MIALLLSAALLQAGPATQGTGPENVLDRFLHAVTIRDSTTALSLISGSAFRLVDSMAEEDPGRLADLVGGFGVTVDPATIGSEGSRALLRDVLTSDALLGLLALAEFEVGSAVIEGSRALLPVDYSFMGNEGTITIEFRQDNGRWRLSDYYGHSPLGG